MAEYIDTNGVLRSDSDHGTLHNCGYFKDDSVPESTTNIIMGFELFLNSSYHIGLRRDPLTSYVIIPEVPSIYNWDSARKQIIHDVNNLFDSASNTQVSQLRIAESPHPEIYYDSGEVIDWTYLFDPPLDE